MKLKLMNVIPATNKTIITDEAMKYITQHLYKDTVVDSRNIPEGTASIECEYDDMVNAPHAVELCRQAEKEGYQGCFINCFADPGVRAARECVDIPVFGGFEPATHIAMGLGDRIGVILPVKHAIGMVRANIAKAHLDERVVAIRSIDIPVLDLGQHEKLVKAMIDESVRAIEEDGVEVIVAGCTGMIGVTEDIQQGLFDLGYDVPVIEAAQSALMMLELYARMGLKQSRITYMKPPKKI